MQWEIFCNHHFRTYSKLKEAYIKAIPFISIVKIRNYKWIAVENLEKDKLMKAQEIRLKRIEKYMEEKERIDNVKKPWEE